MFTKISPLGKRVGDGTFDTFFDTSKYRLMEEAKAANDLVQVDFVKDDNGVVFLEFYHIQKPEDKKYHRLMIQHFPFGVDVFDDAAACELAPTLFKNNNQ